MIVQIAEWIIVIVIGVPLAVLSGVIAFKWLIVPSREYLQEASHFWREEFRSIRKR